jgi:IS30 family transposase
MTMASMKQQGISARAMALGRSPSTITRELAHNTMAALPYGSNTAQVAYVSRRVAGRPVGRLDFNGVGWGTVRTLLDWKWSPQQIAATRRPPSWRTAASSRRCTFPAR